MVKKVMYLLIVVFLTAMYSCSSDNNDDFVEPGDLEKEKTLLTGATIFSIQPSAEYASTGGNVYSWEYDDKGRIVKMILLENDQEDHSVPFTVAYSDKDITINSQYKASNAITYITYVADIEDNRIVSVFELTKTVWNTEAGEIENTQTNGKREKYYYTADGYLDKITSVDQNEVETLKMQTKIENGNIVSIDEAYSKGVFDTYNYTYDDKEYIPMGDYTFQTPQYLVNHSYLFILGDYLGKKNKNNIIQADFNRKSSNPLFWTKLTYAYEIDKYNKLIKIKHSGFENSITYAGQEIKEHKSILTTLRYEVPQK